MADHESLLADAYAERALARRPCDACGEPIGFWRWGVSADCIGIDGEVYHPDCAPNQDEAEDA